MKLSQRLTRAGLAFIVFGTAASLLPTTGNASAATDGCTVLTQSYSIGIIPQGRVKSYVVIRGTFITLESYLGTAIASGGVLTSTDKKGFKTTVRGSTVTTTASIFATGSDAVTITFAGGHTVSYTVSVV